MAITTALLLLAALPESGAVTRAQATARIVAAEEIDFARPGVQSNEREALFRLVRSRSVIEPVELGTVNEL
jgi:hypothetical protein